MNLSKPVTMIQKIQKFIYVAFLSNLIIQPKLSREVTRIRNKVLGG